MIIDVLMKKKIDCDLNLCDVAIPYKNWENSPYEVIGWPINEKFNEFKFFNADKKKKILQNILQLEFVKKNV